MVDFAEIMRKANEGSGSSDTSGGSSSNNSGNTSEAMGDARPQNNGASDFNPNATSNTSSSDQSGTTQTENKERSVQGEAALKPEQKIERDLAREAEVAAINLAHTQGISGREKEELVFAARTAGQFGGKDADIQAIMAETHQKVVGRPIDQQQQPDYMAQALAAARGTGISGIIGDVTHSTGHQFAKQTNGEQKRDTGLDVALA